MKKIIAGIILIVGFGIIANTPASVMSVSKPEVEAWPIEGVVNSAFIKLDVHPLMDRHHLSFRFVPLHHLDFLERLFKPYPKAS
ncbi:hypothetical protein [Lysinibacillus fusiformis]|uniref:hypothetical protein n=1 Tax=Lysinibacillus fusiformis TaxID=28031 RepID=UPI0035BF988E|nr:hypothetical protein QYY55_10550 [Lysinibacillus fusiformis]